MQKDTELLTKLLADLYVIYNNIQNFHWNYKGKDFLTLHKFFQEEYEFLQEKIDETAETILFLGNNEIVMDLNTIISQSSITPHNSGFEREVVLKKMLIDMQEVTEVISGDHSVHQITQDLFASISGRFLKTCWIIRSSL